MIIFVLSWRFACKGCCIIGVETLFFLRDAALVLRCMFSLASCKVTHFLLCVQLLSFVFSPFRLVPAIASPFSS